MEYRVERKYLCTDYEIELLKHRLENVLSQDVHQQNDCYRVRSLYFDTWNDACFYGNSSGINERSKYRIRIYDGSDEKISFEIKQKRNGYTKKEACEIGRDECEMLMAGGQMRQVMGESSVRNRVIMQQRMNLLRPVTIIEYERSAYVSGTGNVRITFDRNIGASRNASAFLEKKCAMVPILTPHMHLLEVKYDELLPDYISQLLDLEKLKHTSFSKYYLGRQTIECGRS